MSLLSDDLLFVLLLTNLDIFLLSMILDYLRDYINEYISEYCKYCKKRTHTIDYCCQKVSLPCEIIVEIVEKSEPGDFRELLHLTIKSNVYENFKSLFDYVDESNYNDIYEVLRKIDEKGDLYNLKRMDKIFGVNFYPIPCNGGRLIHICKNEYKLPLSKLSTNKIVVQYDLGRYGEFNAYVEYPSDLLKKYKKSDIMNFYNENISIQEFNYIENSGIINRFEFFRDYIYDESSLSIVDWTHKMKLRFLDIKSINCDNKDNCKLVDELFLRNIKNVDLEDYPFKDNKPLFPRYKIMGSLQFLDGIIRCHNGKLYILEIGS